MGYGTVFEHTRNISHCIYHWKGIYFINIYIASFNAIIFLEPKVIQKFRENSRYIRNCKNMQERKIRVKTKAKIWWFRAYLPGGIGDQLAGRVAVQGCVARHRYAENAFQLDLKQTKRQRYPLTILSISRNESSSFANVFVLARKRCKHHRLSTNARWSNLYLNL